MRTGLQYIFNRVVTESFIRKVAFEPTSVDIWDKGVSVEGRTSAKVLRPGGFTAQQRDQWLEQVSREET